MAFIVDAVLPEDLSRGFIGRRPLHVQQAGGGYLHVADAETVQTASEDPLGHETAHDIRVAHKKNFHDGTVQSVNYVVYHYRMFSKYSSILWTKTHTPSRDGRCIGKLSFSGFLQEPAVL